MYGKKMTNADWMAKKLEQELGEDCMQLAKHVVGKSKEDIQRILYSLVGSRAGDIMNEYFRRYPK